jgi:hypothetical protein
MSRIPRGVAAGLMAAGLSGAEAAALSFNPSDYDASYKATLDIKLTLPDDVDDFLYFPSAPQTKISKTADGNAVALPVEGKKTSSLQIDDMEAKGGADENFGFSASRSSGVLQVGLDYTAVPPAIPETIDVAFSFEYTYDIGAWVKGGCGFCYADAAYAVKVYLRETRPAGGGTSIIGLYDKGDDVSHGDAPKSDTVMVNLVATLFADRSYQLFAEGEVTGDAFAQQVPAPAAGPLALTALAALLAFRRRRAK